MLKRAPRHRDRIRGDLTNGFGHLRSATTVAADGARQRVAPAMDNALVRMGIRKRPRRRWPWVVGSIAIATAAAGAAGYAVWRRNNAAFEAEADALLVEETNLGTDANRQEHNNGRSAMGNRAHHMATPTS